MKLSYCISITIFVFNLFTHPCFGQDENLEPGIRPWYSLSLSKTFNKKLSISQYSLVALRSKSHEFWLGQVDWSVRYRMNKRFTFQIGYGQTFYKYSEWWESRYEHDPVFSHLIRFHILTTGIQHKYYPNRTLSLSNKIVIQHYLPAFEKYQTRFRWISRIELRSIKSKQRIRPYLEASLYYYLNGQSVNYDAEEILAPNGLHRYRLKAGMSFRPLRRMKGLTVSVYTFYNREFNLSALGSPLNVSIPTSQSKEIVRLPFAKYGVMGIHFSYRL